MEILGIMIRENKSIKGIVIGKEEFCLLQYADDTCLFLDSSEESLKSALDLLFQFSKFSGLKPNIEKTEVVWIGSKSGCMEQMCNSYNLKWNDSVFTVLGIHFTSDLVDIEKLNFSP